MDNVPKYLRSNVIVEPLVDRFYAWAHTIAPVQSAMNLAFVQIPLIESYLQSPQVHIAACRNPALRGGYFIDIGDDRAGELRELLAFLKRDRGELLTLA